MFEGRFVLVCVEPGLVIMFLWLALALCFPIRPSRSYLRALDLFAISLKSMSLKSFFPGLNHNWIYSKFILDPLSASKRSLKQLLKAGISVVHFVPIARVPSKAKETGSYYTF